MCDRCDGLVTTINYKLLFQTRDVLKFTSPTLNGTAIYRTHLSEFPINRLVFKRSMFLILLAAAAVAGQQPAPKIQALIITGQNGHDWRATTPVLRKLLEDTGRFEVRVTEEFRGAGPRP